MSLVIPIPSVCGYSAADEIVSVSETFNPESEKYYHKILLYIGEFSRVVKCLQKEGHRRSEKDKQCVIKTVRRTDQTQGIQDEAAILKLIRGENFLLQYLDDYSTNLFHYTVTEYIARGSLDDLLTNEYPSGVGENNARFYLSEILSALQTLHKKGIYHGDLTPQNILLDENGHVVLCDFDSSSYEGLGGIVTESTDWYSFGVLAHVIACNEVPFLLVREGSLEIGIDEKYNFWSDDTDCKESRKSSSREMTIFTSFVLLLLSPAEGVTIDVENMKAHPYLESVDWGRVANKQMKPPLLPKVKPGEEDRQNDGNISDEDEKIIDIFRKMSTGFCISRIL